MTSRNLFFKLQMEDLKRRIWTIVVAMLMFFLSLPVLCAMRLENYNNDITNKIASKKWVVDQLLEFIGPKNSIVILITFVGAIICGLSGFIYLHSKKKVDFYHSIPVRRETLFAINYINGLLIYLVPYLINIILCFIVLSIKNFMSMEIFTTALGAIGVGLLFYSLIYTFVVIAVMLTGNFIISCFGTVVFFFYGPLITVLKEMYFGTFFETFYSNKPNLSDRMLDLSPIGSYANIVKQIDSGTNQGITGSIIKVLIVTIVLIALAIFLYKKRPSEAAGKAMSFEFSKPVIKFLLVIPLSLGGGLMAREISRNGSNGWFIFGLIFSLIIIYAIIEIIYNFDIRSAFHYKKQMLACAGIIAIVVCIFQFDLFHYDAYIPSENKVASMSVAISGVDDSYQYFDLGFQDGNYMDSDSYQMEYMELTDFAAAYDLSKLGTESIGNKIDMDKYYSYKVKFTLKNGREVYRNYQLSINQGSEMLKDVFGSVEFKKGHYPIYQCTAEQIRSISCYNKLLNKEFGLNTSQKKQLLEIYKEDLKSLTLDELVTNPPIAVISMNVYTKNNSFNISNFVYPSFEKTIAFLKEHGFNATNEATIKDVKKIQVINYNAQPEDIYDDNSMVSDVKATSNSATYDDVEQIQEIFPVLIQNDYYYGNSTILNVDEGIEVSVVIRKDQYGNEENYSFFFAKDKTPDFVKKDIGYKVE